MKTNFDPVHNPGPYPKSKRDLALDAWLDTFSAQHENCADEPCADCVADAADDFDHALDCARDAGVL